MRRLLSLALAGAMFLSLLGTAYAGNHENGTNQTTHNSVLFATNISVNGTKLTAPDSTHTPSEISNNLLGFLDSDTETKQSLSLGGNKTSVTKATYVTGAVSLSGNTVTIAAPLVSEGDITISAANVVVNDSAFLLSKTGSINIYCTNLMVNGPIAAAKKVFVTGSKAIVNEAVFAKTIECYVGTYQTDDTINETILRGPKDKLAEISCYTMEDKPVLFVNSNFDFDSMDIYVRREGEDIFALVAKENNAETELLASWYEYTDFAAIITNPFGYAMKTDPLSIEIVDGTVYSVYGADSDADGVTDAFELWLTETDPEVTDTFPNPEYYVYISDDYGTTCYDRLLRRDVSFTTEEYSKEYSYEDPNYPGRVSETIVRYTDGSTKQIRYEYENDRLRNLYVGDNKYTIIEDDKSIRYYVNNTCIKQVSLSEAQETVNHFDTVAEIYQFDSESNLVSYQNGSQYQMTYDNLDLMNGLAKNGVPYATYTYDAYGNFVTIDASDYSIHYTYAYPTYRADYTFGENHDTQKVQQVTCKDDAYACGDIVLLTDGTNGSAIPTTTVGEIVSADANAKTLRYRIGTEEHFVQFDVRGYVIKDTAGNTTTEYQYDTYGNIKKVTTNIGGQTKTCTYSYDSAWSDELVSFDGMPIRYNTLGKPIEYYNGMNFTWAAGKLASVIDGNNHTSYTYDYQGLRDEKTVNGVTTKYLYEGRDLIAELSDDPVYYTYDGNFNLVGFEWNNEAYYYQYDIFGDVIGIKDTTGNQLCSYTYDLWGEITAITGDIELANRNSIRYRGYYYDNETGLYYLEARYYDPHVKRFLSYDDLESFFYGDEEDMESLFVYCGNNPVIYCDTYGRSAYVNEIFTLTEFRDESLSVANAVDNYFVGKGHSSKTHVYRFTSADYFVKLWNYSNTNSVIIVNSHGCSTSIGTKGPEITIDISMVRRLNKKTLGLLWLLGCNCGHYDFNIPESNIVRAFAKKITGAVIAADGTVKACWFSSSSFKTNGSGWYVFRFYNYGSTFYMNELGTTKLSVKRALEMVGY